MAYGCDPPYRKPPLKIKILYAMGQFGWSLASFGAANLINYFYLPPTEGSEAIFPGYIFQGYVIGILTVIGLMNFGGRLFDAITDPMIAGWSDRSKASFGKRRKFMALSMVPFAMLSFLIFYPPVNGVSSFNSVWLGIVLIAFYFFMTLYVVPYTALMSELGHTPNERLDISTMISVTWALGFAIGQQVYLMQDLLEAMTDPTTAFQMVMALFALVSFLCMMLPVLFVNEKKYCKTHPSTESSWQAVKSSFRNINYRYFIFSDLTYWLSVTFIQTGMVYYITILMNMNKETTSIIMLGIFGLSFLMYAPVNLMAKKIGKKRVQSIAFLVFLINFGFVIFLGAIPLPDEVQLAIVGILASIPLACFGIIPNAIIADIADEDLKKQGSFKPAIFFAMRAFMMKFGIASANLIFPSLLLLGNSSENDLGVRLTAFVAMIACGIGFWLFQSYKDPTESYSLRY